MASVVALLLISFFSFTAEFWANSKPLFLKYHGSYFVPFVSEYHPSEFGREDIFVMDYRALEL